MNEDLDRIEREGDYDMPLMSARSMIRFTDQCDEELEREYQLRQERQNSMQQAVDDPFNLGFQALQVNANDKNTHKIDSSVEVTIEASPAQQDYVCQRW